MCLNGLSQTGTKCSEEFLIFLNFWKFLSNMLLSSNRGLNVAHHDGILHSLTAQMWSLLVQDAQASVCPVLCPTLNYAMISDKRGMLIADAFKDIQIHFFFCPAEARFHLMYTL